LLSFVYQAVEVPVRPLKSDCAQRKGYNKLANRYYVGDCLTN
jgi:hypothetical protein